MIGGRGNLLRDCVVRNVGTVGVHVGRFDPALGQRVYADTMYRGEGGEDNGVEGCRVSACGEGGVMVHGGDRATLRPGRNFVVDCELWDTSRWVRTYRSAVFLWGVGVRVAHNFIHDLPHTAVFFWGNDHVLEFNEVHSVCLETGDAGAFYVGRDWTQRGHVIRGNYFHHLRGVEGRPGFTDVMGVYLDDFASGVRVEGNVFYKAGRSIMIGGGRDNVVENNIVVDGAPGLSLDARGTGWAKSYFDGTDRTMFKRLEAVRPDRPPWSERYPGLAGVAGDEPALPKGNVVARNIFFGGRWVEYQDGLDRLGLVRFDRNWTEGDPGFVDARRGDFRLRPDAPALAGGFKPIPFDEIGPSWRKRAPVVDPSRDLPRF